MRTAPRVVIDVTPRLLGETLARVLRELDFDVTIDGGSDRSRSFDIALTSHSRPTRHAAAVVVEVPCGSSEGASGAVVRGDVRRAVALGGVDELTTLLSGIAGDLAQAG